MLAPIRKFSTSIFAKILLLIIIIPFVFWGMGSSLTGGNKNIVVVIDKEKYSIQDLSTFIKRTASKEVKSDDVENFLYTFIGEKLIETEIEKNDIRLSDKSLSKLIKQQKGFKRDNKFSRTEYEKFLIQNNITAVIFESLLSKEEKRKQMLNFIGGGIYPPKFAINISYDKANQKREVDVIDLNKAYQKKLNFSEDQIKTYFNNNKSKYSEIYRTVKILELNPSNLVDNKEFTDLFFKKIDEIDDLIISGVNLNEITQKYNLEVAEVFSIDASGKNINFEDNKKIANNLIKKIFTINESEPTLLIEDENKYFLVELVKTDNIVKDIKNEKTKREVLSDLKIKTKRLLISEIIDKINKSAFTKLDFDDLSKDTGANIVKVSLNNKNDGSLLDKQIVQQIYSHPEKKIIVVSDLGFAENYLIYIDKIINVNINNNSEDYQKYQNLSKARIIANIYNTYDDYVKKKYKIDINYQALDIVKNYFN